ncbi:hypothetical protein HanIR_Chr17g0879401 [Helianthus annuus]|nr:hypothetical protein HanIR_Chr17g0879401 [Helianthus annuus]
MTSTSSEAVNVDGRKQELIDASEASVFFFWFADTKKGTSLLVFVCNQRTKFS